MTFFEIFTYVSFLMKMVFFFVSYRIRYEISRLILTPASYNFSYVSFLFTDFSMTVGYDKRNQKEIILKVPPRKIYGIQSFTEIEKYLIKPEEKDENNFDRNLTSDSTSFSTSLHFPEYGGAAFDLSVRNCISFVQFFRINFVLKYQNNNICVYYRSRIKCPLFVPALFDF